MGRMGRWQHIVDQLLTDVIGDGDVSHLPGAGKPLRLADESHSPDDCRVAFKIMRDHNVLPEWIETAEALDQQEAELRRRIAEWTRRRQAGLETGDAAALRERILRHNREVMLLNLKLPAGLPHKPILEAEALMPQALRRSSLTPRDAPTN